MRYALIMAGGSGTRLWPMSTKALPKQLIPFIGGRSLLQIAMERLDGLVPPERVYVGAGESTRDVMMERLPGMTADRFIGEPMGRDTLNAVGLGCAVLLAKDPDATVAIFTADHIIEPIDQFLEIVDRGYALAEAEPDTLVTFGITPTHAATGYGYLALGDAVSEYARRVDAFKEKPEAPVAEQYFAAGGEKYLWNSGMFVWKAATVMDCIRRYEPENYAVLSEIGAKWGEPETMAKLPETFGSLKKVSVDYAVMEPASQDDQVKVAAVPMGLTWLDVGSWPSFAETCETDAGGNALGAEKHVLMDSEGTLVASDDPEHLIATLGVEDLIVIHTGKATLVCPQDRAEEIKKLHAAVGESAGTDYL
ncbi:MAG: mannose-1-phosphate guanylyltransferase [Planctomycetota bacterium]